MISGSEGNVSASANTNANANVGVGVSVGVASPPQPPLTPATTVVSPDLSIQSSGNTVIVVININWSMQYRLHDH